MTIWIKPSGVEIELNDFDATVEMAESLDWKKKTEKKVVKRKKKIIEV
jgi:hypothetical protein